MWLDIEITTEDYLHDIQRHSGADGGICRWKCCWCAPQPRAARENTAQRPAETLSELKVEEVFEVRLALTEIDDMKRPGCMSCSPIRCIRSPRRMKTHENPQSASENPNSRKGMEDRLTAEPFASNGLFAITGATGAGNHAARCQFALALYHETPRLNKVSQSQTT